MTQRKSPPHMSTPKRRAASRPVRDWLALWRSSGPARLLKDPALVDGLAAFLTRRFKARTSQERQLLDGVRQGRQVGACAFHLARLLYGQHRVPVDLTASWLLLAALHQHELAIAALAQLLRDWAFVRAAESWALEEQHGPPLAARAARRQAILARRLAARWAEEQDLSFLAPPERWRRLFEAPRLPLRQRRKSARS